MNKKISKIKPYLKGEQPFNKNSIKLNTNENPYHPNILIIKNIIKEIMCFGNLLKFYPDPDSEIIKNQIVIYYNLKKEEIFIGNGSDDVLANIFLTFFKNKKKLYIIDLTYSFYESFIKLYKINYVIIKTDKNFSINTKKFKEKKNNIIINNPNAPVGKSINNIEIKIIVKKIKAILVLDETYEEFINKTFIKSIKIKKNVIITQSFSKSKSLAGIRIGFAVASKNLIEKMLKTKDSLNSYPVNILSQISCKKIIINNLYLEKIIKKINKNKNFLKKKLKKMGFETINSETNFILTTNKNININKLIKHLTEKNIFLRKFEIPKIENYVRITIGKKEECLKLIKNINIFLKINN